MQRFKLITEDWKSAHYFRIYRKSIKRVDVYCLLKDGNWVFCDSYWF